MSLLARSCVSHAVLLHCAAVLRRCAPPGGVSVGISHEKLFAKVAVQIVAVNLIWAFVGVFCAMCVSWSVVVVCMNKFMPDTHGVAL